MRKLLDTKPRIFDIPPHEPTHDRAPDSLATGTPEGLLKDLVGLLGSEDAVKSSALDLIRYATDASPYRMFPKAVVMSRSVEDVQKVLAYAHSSKIPVTFRSAGTSLSGQAQGDGILVETMRHWIGCTVEEEGRVLRSKPGTILGRANAILARHGYRLGPDPGSKAACTIGGVIANNASGMCCGTTENSYRMVRSMTVVLPSGTVVDTGAPDADERFAAAEPEIAAGLMKIKHDIESDPETAERIRKKFTIKNTTGYSMNAFLDGSTPVEILRGIMVGSEGTLGFIAEAVFETVRDDKERLTSLMIFPDMHTACSAVAPFVEAGAAAVELLDRASIRAVKGRPGVHERWDDLPDTATALLVEFRDPTPEASRETERKANAILRSLTLQEETEFTRDPKRAADFWVIRNGLLAVVGGARPSGTSFILEDVCFPPERIADGAIELQKLFARHDYPAVIFGHASAGNLHFLVTPSLKGDEDVARFDAFLKDVVSTVADGFDGSLKAEHGTGRNIAPFVEQEWGKVITGHMWAVKKLFDPAGILSPGVLLTDDPNGHLKNLKTAPTIEPIADRCIECGYCEHVCPSRRVTTTPRQRIALRREMVRQPAGSPVAVELNKEYGYNAVETCAGDGTCAIACPVDINTGEMMKGFRKETHEATSQAVGLRMAKNFKALQGVSRMSVGVARGVGDTLGDWSIEAVTKLGRVFVSHDLMPNWLPEVPGAAKRKLPKTEHKGASAVYFPACINRIFGNPDSTDEQGSLPEVLVTLAERAGQPVWIPPDIRDTCCGTIWHSKGLSRGNEWMANKVIESLWEWSDHGRLPIISDATSCTLGLIHEVEEYLTPENAEHHKKMRIMDSIQWAKEQIIPVLPIKSKVPSAVIHSTCAGQNLGLTSALEAVAKSLAEEVTVPVYGTCCGFAGDRGMLHPELTDNATAEQVKELEGQKFDAYLCSNRTCEIGMSRAMGEDYASFLFLLEKATR